MSDTSKATPDYRVTFACSECMFSTASGISAQAHRDWHKQEDQLYEELENRVVELGIRESIGALRSYNPKRDKLARELALAVRDERVEFLKDWRVIACQLLKLY